MKENVSSKTGKEPSLRHDLPYLRLIVNEGVRTHPKRPPEEDVMLANLRDYLIWLTMDALEDARLANTLLHSFAILESELNSTVADRRNRRLDPSAPAFYEAIIQTLRLVLSHRHKAALELFELQDRHEFINSWEWTRKVLDLSACACVLEIR